MPARPAIRSIVVQGLVLLGNLLEIIICLDFFRIDSAMTKMVQ